MFYFTVAAWKKIHVSRCLRCCSHSLDNRCQNLFGVGGCINVGLGESFYGFWGGWVVGFVRIYGRFGGLNVDLFCLFWLSECQGFFRFLLHFITIYAFYIKLEINLCFIFNRINSLDV